LVESFFEIEPLTIGKRDRHLISRHPSAAAVNAREDFDRIVHVTILHYRERDAIVPDRPLHAVGPINVDHCCPKQDRVVRMPAEGKGLESRKSGFSG
jgi:hypothetical protein